MGCKKDTQEPVEDVIVAENTRVIDQKTVVPVGQKLVFQVHLISVLFISPVMMKVMQQ